MNELIQHIQKSPLVQAAITEAVSRFYYDRILSDKEKDKIALKESGASELLSYLWNLQPDWRFILDQTAQRYKAAETTSMPIDGKPTRTAPFVIEIKIKSNKP